MKIKLTIFPEQMPAAIEAERNIEDLEEIDNKLRSIHKYSQVEEYDFDKFLKDFEDFEHAFGRHRGIDLPQMEIEFDSEDEYEFEKWRLYVKAEDVARLYDEFMEVLLFDICNPKEEFLELIEKFNLTEEYEDELKDIENLNPSVQDFAYLYRRIMSQLFLQHNCADMLR